MNRFYLLLILIPVLLQTAAQSQSPVTEHRQYIQLQKGSCPLGQLFNNITQQTGYKLIYDAAVLNKDAVITIRKEKILLDSIPLLFLVPLGLTWQQVDRTIIIRKLPVASLPTVNDRIKELDSVIVYHTGYEDLKPEYSTGSFDQPAFGNMGSLAGATVLTALEKTGSHILTDFRGQSPGKPLTNPQAILIRGTITLTKEISAPLIVVDNYIFEGDLQDLNLADIQSVTILKDAAAAGIWGARAGNGVIVLTTTAGSYSHPMELKFTAQTGMGEKPRLFRYPRLSTVDYIHLERYLFANGFYDAALAQPSGGGLSPVVELLELHRQGRLGDEETESRLETLQQTDGRNDFYKFIYRNALYHQAVLQLNGGLKKYKYALFATMNREASSLKGDENSLLALRSAHSFQLSRAWELHIGGYFTRAELTNNSPGEWQDKAYDYGREYQLRKLYPYARLADDEGRPLAIPHSYRTVWADTVAGGQLGDWQYRPLEELQLADNRMHRRSLALNGNLVFHPVEWFRAAFQYQHQRYLSLVHNNHSASAYFARDLVNRFTRLEDTSRISAIPPGDILDEDRNLRSAENFRIQLSVDKRPGEKQHINVLAGGELREVSNDSRSRRRYGVSFPDQQEGTPVDYTRLFSQFGTGGYARIPDHSGYSHTVDRYLSCYINGSYSPDPRYILSAGLRKDASNLFGVHINNKWKPFWWGGFSWIISREPFFKDKKWPWLRFRASYGTQGNVNNRISPLTLIQYPSAVNSFAQPYANIRKPADFSLSWETVRQTDLGIDLGNRNQRIGASLDVYSKRSTNILFNAVQDASTGFSSMRRNSAGMRSRGAEAILHFQVTRSKLKWGFRLGFNYMNNAVTNYELSDAGRTGLNGFVENSSQTIYPLKGLPVYSIHSYPFAGLDPNTGDPLGWLNDQVSRDYQAIIYRQAPDKKNLVYHGPALPAFFGNWDNQLNWKHLSLSAGISYRLGYYYRKATVNYYNLYHYGITHADYTLRWQHPGDERLTVIPSRPEPEKKQSDRDLFFAGTGVNVRKADNLRLQYIKLCYRSEFVKPRKSSGIQEWECFAAVLNPGILWKANHLAQDPDYNQNESFYPVPRSYTVGVSVRYKIKSRIHPAEPTGL